MEFTSKALITRSPAYKKMAVVYLLNDPQESEDAMVSKIEAGEIAESMLVTVLLLVEIRTIQQLDHRYDYLINVWGYGGFLESSDVLLCMNEAGVKFFKDRLIELWGLIEEKSREFILNEVDPVGFYIPNYLPANVVSLRDPSL